MTMRTDKSLPSKFQLGDSVWVAARCERADTHDPIGIRRNYGEWYAYAATVTEVAFRADGVWYGLEGSRAEIPVGPHLESCVFATREEATENADERHNQALRELMR